MAGPLSAPLAFLDVVVGITGVHYVTQGLRQVDRAINDTGGSKLHESIKLPDFTAQATKIEKQLAGIKRQFSQVQDAGAKIWSSASQPVQNADAIKNAKAILEAHKLIEQQVRFSTNAYRGEQQALTDLRRDLTDMVAQQRVYSQNYSTATSELVKNEAKKREAIKETTKAQKAFDDLVKQQNTLKTTQQTTGADAAQARRELANLGINAQNNQVTRPVVRAAALINDPAVAALQRKIDNATLELKYRQGVQQRNTQAEQMINQQITAAKSNPRVTPTGPTMTRLNSDLAKVQKAGIEIQKEIDTIGNERLKLQVNYQTALDDSAKSFDSLVTKWKALWASTTKKLKDDAAKIVNLDPKIQVSQQNLAQAQADQNRLTTIVQQGEAKRLAIETQAKNQEAAIAQQRASINTQSRTVDFLGAQLQVDKQKLQDHIALFQQAGKTLKDELAKLNLPEYLSGITKSAGGALNSLGGFFSGLGSMAAGSGVLSWPTKLLSGISGLVGGLGQLGSMVPYVGPLFSVLGGAGSAIIGAAGGIVGAFTGIGKAAAGAVTGVAGLIVKFISMPAVLTPLTGGLNLVIQNFDTILKTIGLIGAAIAGLAIKDVLQEGASYEQSRADLQSLLRFQKPENLQGGTAIQTMKDLDANILQLAADTVFSNDEVSKTFEALIRGGMSASLLVGNLGYELGSLALNLAKVAKASPEMGGQTIAIVSKLFGDTDASPTGKLTSDANIIGAVLATTNMGIGEFNAALTQTGAIAASLGVPLEDLAVVLDVLGQKGIMGEEAGTAWKNFFLFMQGKSKPAKEALQQYGLWSSSGASLDAPDTAKLAENQSKYNQQIADNNAALQLAMIARDKIVNQMNNGAKKTAAQRQNEALSLQAADIRIQQLQNKPIEYQAAKDKSDAGAKGQGGHSIFFDDSGNFIGVEKTLDAINKATAGMSDEQLLDFEEKVFGSRTGRIISIIKDTTGKAVEQTRELLKSVGLDKLVGDQQNTVTGKLEILTGTLKSIASKFFLDFLAPNIRGFLDQFIQPMNTVLAFFAQTPTTDEWKKQFGDATVAVAVFGEVIKGLSTGNLSATFDTLKSWLTTDILQVKNPKTGDLEPKPLIDPKVFDNISGIVQKGLRVTQLVRDSFITFKDAWMGTWGNWAKVIGGDDTGNLADTHPMSRQEQIMHDALVGFDPNIPAPVKVLGAFARWWGSIWRGLGDVIGGKITLDTFINNLVDNFEVLVKTLGNIFHTSGPGLQTAWEQAWKWLKDTGKKLWNEHLKPAMTEMWNDFTGWWDSNHIGDLITNNLVIETGTLAVQATAALDTMLAGINNWIGGGKGQGGGAGKIQQALSGLWAAVFAPLKKDDTDIFRQVKGPKLGQIQPEATLGSSGRDQMSLADYMLLAWKNAVDIVVVQIPLLFNKVLAVIQHWYADNQKTINDTVSAWISTALDMGKAAVQTWWAKDENKKAFIDLGASIGSAMAQGLYASLYDALERLMPGGKGGAGSLLLAVLTGDKKKLDEFFGIGNNGATPGSQRDPKNNGAGTGPDSPFQGPGGPGVYPQGGQPGWIYKSPGPNKDTYIGQDGKVYRYDEHPSQRPGTPNNPPSSRDSWWNDLRGPGMSVITPQQGDSLARAYGAGMEAGQILAGQIAQAPVHNTIYNSFNGVTPSAMADEFGQWLVNFTQGRA